MAGSYNHVVTKDGSLRKPELVCGMLEARGSGDVYEAVEEMYGMIWYLAHELSARTADDEWIDLPENLVEEARVNYKNGLVQSPTKRFE